MQIGQTVTIYGFNHLPNGTVGTLVGIGNLAHVRLSAHATGRIPWRYVYSNPTN